MARVLRGGRSGGPLIPAIFRRRAEEGVAALLPRLGSSPVAPAASAGRLMHTGFGGSTKLQQEKALPFGRTWSSLSRTEGHDKDGAVQQQAAVYEWF
ncbi:hypothetical protein C2845_PM05G14930 [Panicum miliaceum]|uniref:Uncharacterized protein n=1 Tax=Panicum miliaceum TaxID=4540 RepID=A0A3L6SWX0_PANMI|nr:hypothetical protein C2845_PM05G14930 [Panicum miliaceum]